MQLSFFFLLFFSLLLVYHMDRLSCKENKNKAEEYWTNDAIWLIH